MDVVRSASEKLYPVGVSIVLNLLHFPEDLFIGLLILALLWRWRFTPDHLLVEFVSPSLDFTNANNELPNCWMINRNDRLQLSEIVFKKQEQCLSY